MADFKIPKTPREVYITGKSGTCYTQFRAFNIDDDFPTEKINSSIIITLKKLDSLNGDINKDSDIYISYHGINSTSDKINDTDYGFMALKSAKDLGANYFFYLRWFNQNTREQILNDIMEGGYFDFEKSK